MNVKIVNHGAVPLPFGSADGDGFIASLEPGVAFSMNHPDITVASIGDNPSFRVELEQAARALRESVVSLFTFWREHHKADGTPLLVRVLITNYGPNFLRVSLGDHGHELEIAPETTYNAESAQYIKLRELEPEPE